MKKICDEKIMITNKIDDGEKNFHLFFDNYDDMVFYNMFVVVFIGKINKKRRFISHWMKILVNQNTSNKQFVFIST